MCTGYWLNHFTQEVAAVRLCLAESSEIRTKEGSGINIKHCVFVVT